MSQIAEILVLLGGRLAIDFANAPSYPSAPSHDFSWEEFVGFLEAARIVSAERSDQLLTLPETDPRAAHALLTRAVRLRDALREIFTSLVRNEPIASDWAKPINDVLRITEGHDELLQTDEGRWSFSSSPAKRARLAARRRGPLRRRNRAGGPTCQCARLRQSGLWTFLLRQIPHAQTPLVLDGDLRQSQ